MRVNALQIRQSLGKVLKKLETLGRPIIIEKGRQPVAVLISLKLFQERFVDYREQQQREQLLQAFQETGVAPAADSLEVLRGLRYGADH